MPYWDEDDTEHKLGYNKNRDGDVEKYSRLTDYYDEDKKEKDKHGHEIIDVATGTYGYRGENADKKEFRKEFDDAKFSK